VVAVSLALAVLVAVALPALHVRGADKALLGLSTWEAVPVATLLKFLALAAAAVTAFVPRFAAYRAPVTAGAIAMMFMPALAALTAAVNHWTSLRAAIVEMSGNRTPWVDPGWGVVVLIVAALLMIGSMIRAARVEAADGAGYAAA
jgi:hypothetical protein